MIATHFREHTEEALKIMGLQTNPGWSDSQRRRMDGQEDGDLCANRP